MPWMKNLRSSTNSRMVGIEVTMTPVMIHGLKVKQRLVKRASCWRIR